MYTLSENCVKCYNNSTHKKYIHKICVKQATKTHKYIIAITIKYVLCIGIIYAYFLYELAICTWKYKLSELEA